MIHLLIAIALLGLVLCDVEKKCGKCPTTAKVYEELRCVGVLDNDGCCFERLKIIFFQTNSYKKNFNFRFDCPDWNALDADKCHYNGKSYNIYERMSGSDSPKCQPACFCREGYFRFLFVLEHKI